MILIPNDIDTKLKQVDLRYYENQTEPELDFTVTAARQDVSGNTLTTRFDNDSYTLSSAIKFSMPLGGDIKDEENVTIARLNLQKIQLDYASKLTNLIADVSSLITSLTLDKSLLKTYPQTLDKLSIDIKDAMESNAQYSSILNTLKIKRDIFLEYIEVMLRYQLNIIEYEDHLDRIVA